MFSFIKYTKLWFIFSGIILLIGFAAIVRNEIISGEAMKWGIDFKGGSSLEYSFMTPSEDLVQGLRDTVNAVYQDSVTQVTSTDQGTYILQARDFTEEELQSISQAIQAKYGDAELLRFTTIGPKIGATLKHKALIALTIAMIAIVLYISYAFRNVPKRISPWRFGLCAIIALFHDAFATIGFYTFIGFEVDALFITALLTIIGFSVHDTIVVFDRIRENLKFQGHDDTFGTIADKSLNQTLARSINTSVSVMIPLAALAIFGAPSIKTFAITLIFGITIGTYSSIFIASPLLVWWQKKVRIH